MKSQEDRRRRVEDESRAALPSGHQGFVRGGDVHDTKSQAAAPSGPGRAFDRSGEKHYEADLQEFERELGEDGAGDDDERLRVAICRRLAEAAGIDADAITVAVHDGIAVLTGRAAAPARHRAEEIAAAVGGIDGVRNQIELGC